MRMMMDGSGRNGLPKTIMSFFYGYFLLHWLSGFLMFREKIGFTRADVSRYYLGDPEMFINPRSFQGLLEVTHFHLFAMGLFFVIFTHLLMFTGLRESIKRALSWFLAVAIIADLAAGYLVRFVAPVFAWVKLGAFWMLQAVSLMLFCALIHALVHPRR